ncbi:MAG: cytochrome c biogenesis protein CcsA [Bacteroidales bacterium]|nr:cytochrome c biogenesis protein CcsA [Bacteroidales bacterium]
MIWSALIWFFVAFVSLSLFGAIFVFKQESSKLNLFLSRLFPLLANLVLLSFTVILWLQLERPPMKTMAETRLLYAVFVGMVTWIIVFKTKSKWMYFLGYTMSAVFLLVDLLHPEYQQKNLMPALQSVWFIPHVVVYMISYAVLGAACLSALKGLWGLHRKKAIWQNDLDLAMNLVYPGTALLTIGMLLGAIWAKIAWGNYWSFDPKETWALLTWLFYIITIHIHYAFPKRQKLILWMLSLSFLVLIITWLGIRFVPAAMQSIHVY